MTTSQADGPDEPTRAPSADAAPRRWWSFVPHHLGRARTSTVVLALLFVGLYVLWLYVRPPDVPTAPVTDGTVQTPATTAPAEPPATTAPTTTAPAPTTSPTPEPTSLPPAGTDGEGTPSGSPPAPTPTGEEPTTAQPPTPAVPTTSAAPGS